MAYSKTSWANNTTPAINASNLNKMEQGIYDANILANDTANVFSYFSSTGQISIVRPTGDAVERRSITWTPDGISITFSGTSSSPFSYFDLFDNSSALPVGIEKGKTYTAQMKGSGTNPTAVYLQIYTYVNGTISPTTIVGIDSSDDPVTFTLDNNVSGLLIRLRVFDATGSISGKLTPLITSFESINAIVTELNTKADETEIVTLQNEIDVKADKTEVEKLSYNLDEISDYVASVNIFNPATAEDGKMFKGDGSDQIIDGYSRTPYYSLSSGQSVSINAFRKFIVFDLEGTRLEWVDSSTSNYTYTATDDCIFRVGFATTSKSTLQIERNSAPTPYERYFKRYAEVKREINSNTKSLAHQGYNRYAPNQTFAAYKAALEHGFKIVECDVNYTLDGYLICCHNDVVYADDLNKRINPTLTSASGNYSTAITIANTSLATLQEYSWGYWKSSDFENETVLLLEDLIKFCKVNGLHLYLDDAFRAVGDNTRRQALFDMLDKYGMGENVTFVTANTIVAEWNDKTSMSISVGTYTENTLQTAIAIKTAYPNIDVIISIPYTQVTESIAKAVRSNSIHLYGWTVDDWIDIYNLIPMVDGIFSNFYRVEDAINRFNNQ